MPDYAGGIILAYALTRDSLPVEAIGLASKAAEAGLAVIAFLLSRRDP